MDSQFKILANAPAWASQAPSGDTHELSAATPPIVPTDGWGTRYSLSSGTQVAYQSMNQIFLQLSAAAKEVVNGVSAWHASVPYKIGSVTLRNGQLYVSLQDASNQEPSSSPTYWKPVGQSVGIAPDAPRQPAWDNSRALSLVLNWRNGEDHGGLITYRLRWRHRGGTTYSAWESLNYARRQWTSLSVSDRLDVEVQANNGVGWSSTMRTITPAVLAVRTTPPLGGHNLALLAQPRDKSATLRWSTPEDDGGSPITGYIIQYKSGEQTYNNTRQIRLAVTNEHVVPNLLNGTTYTFRVVAVNLVGQSEWSNEANALPSSTPLVGDFGVVGAPTLTRSSDASNPNDHVLNVYAATDITPNPNAPTLTIRSIQWNFRGSGESAWRVRTTSARNRLVIADAEAGSWRVRYRAVTAAGVSVWSPVASIEVGVGAPPPPLVSIGWDSDASTMRALIRARGDGGSNILSTNLRWEFTRELGGVDQLYGTRRRTIPSTYFGTPSVTGYNAAMRNYFNNSNQQVSQQWISNPASVRERFNHKVSVWVRLNNAQGQGDWVESNTVAWRDL